MSKAEKARRSSRFLLLERLRRRSSSPLDDVAISRAVSRREAARPQPRRAPGVRLDAAPPTRAPSARRPGRPRGGAPGTGPRGAPRGLGAPSPAEAEPPSPSPAGRISYFYVKTKARRTRPPFPRGLCIIHIEVRRLKPPFPGVLNINIIYHYSGFAKIRGRLSRVHGRRVARARPLAAAEGRRVRSAA